MKCLSEYLNESLLDPYNGKFDNTIYKFVEVILDTFNKYSKNNLDMTSKNWSISWDVDNPKDLSDSFEQLDKKAKQLGFEIKISQWNPDAAKDHIYKLIKSGENILAVKLSQFKYYGPDSDYKMYIFSDDLATGIMKKPFLQVMLDKIKKLY